MGTPSRLSTLFNAEQPGRYQDLGEVAGRESIIFRRIYRVDWYPFPFLDLASVRLVVRLQVKPRCCSWRTRCFHQFGVTTRMTRPESLTEILDSYVS